MIQFIVAIIAVAAVAKVSLQLQRDYQKFLNLGPGGTPQTLTGFLRVKVLGLFALRDTYTPSIPVSPALQFKEGYLRDVAQRRHTRPTTDGIAPHRQTAQKVSEEVFRKLAAAIESFAPGSNGELTIGTSCFEKNGTGLFATCPANQTCMGEVVHVHPSDGSMHLTLHPADANIVLAAGWGERHPLAGVFFNRFLPEGFMMLYAPQNDEEIEVVLQAIRAACWFVSEGGYTGSDLQGEDGRAKQQGNVVYSDDPRRVLEKMSSS